MTSEEGDNFEVKDAPIGMKITISDLRSQIDNNFHVKPLVVTNALKLLKTDGLCPYFYFIEQISSETTARNAVNPVLEFVLVSAISTSAFYELGLRIVPLIYL